MYKVGDKIKLLVNYYAGCMPNGYGPKIGDILEVVEKNKCSTPGNWIDKYTAEVDGVNTYGNTEFSLLETVKNKFVVSDKVISVKNTPSVPEGFIGHIIDVTGSIWPYTVNDGNGLEECFKEDELELLSRREEGAIHKTTINASVGEAETKPDVINSPKHYAVFEQVEAIEVIASSMTQEQFYGYCLGNCLKYRLRAGAKDDVMQELGKANKYQELYTEHKHLCKGEK